MRMRENLRKAGLTGLSAASLLMLSGAQIVPGLTGAAMAQDVETNTALQSSPRPSVSDTPVSLVATVTADEGTPEGTVRFLEGDNVIGEAPLIPFAPGQGALALGSEHSCALDNAGGVRCTGRNIHGTLGDGTTEQRNAPVGVVGLSSGITAITSTHHHTCALNTLGSVMCWGLGSNGQLGNGMAGSYASPVPVQVTGLESGIVQIAAGGHHTCALTNEGAALCWGDNSRGQLGNTGLEDSYSATPVPVWGMQNGVVAIAAGARHTCGLRDNGRVLCWGSNTNGELGDGTTEDRPLPVRTRHLPLTTTALALGNRHSCALTEEGAVRCWGYGYFGQLGNRTWDDSLLPRGVRRLQSGVTAIAAAQHHTCAILEGGDLRCWGANGSGQLGNNSRVSRNIPIGTWGMRYRTVSAVALGERHTCALEDNGRVWCWGNGTEGQLGMGDLAPDPNDNVEYTPVRMRGRDFGPVEGTAMATFLTDPLPRRRHVFQARYLGSETHLPSWSDVLPHRVTR